MKITIEHRGRTETRKVAEYRMVRGEPVGLTQAEVDERAKEVEAGVKAQIDAEMDVASHLKEKAKAVLDNTKSDPLLIAVEALLMETLEANNADRRDRGASPITPADAKQAAKDRIDRMDL